MDKIINIEDYQDYKTVTIAQYTVALKKLEGKIRESFWKGKFKQSREYAKLYKEIEKLLKKRNDYGHKYGFDGQSKNR